MANANRSKNLSKVKNTYVYEKPRNAGTTNASPTRCIGKAKARGRRTAGWGTGNHESRRKTKRKRTLTAFEVSQIIVEDDIENLTEFQPLSSCRCHAIYMGDWETEM